MNTINTNAAAADQKAKHICVLYEPDIKANNVISGVLMTLHMHIVRVDDIQSALQLAKKQNIDLFILNESSNGMTAFDFVEQVGRGRANVMLLCAEPTREVVLKAIQHGMLDVLAKYSFDIHRFAQKIIKRLNVEETNILNLQALTLDEEVADVDVRRDILLNTKSIDLNTISTFANRMLEITLREDSTFQELEQCVSLDAMITTRVLKVANSPIYRGPSEVTKLSDAIRRLGMDKLREIAISMSLLKDFSNFENYINGQELFKLNILTAIIARRLYEMVGDYAHAEVAFSCGLIHTMGMMILADTIGEDYFRVIEHAAEKNRSQILFEHKYFATDHIVASGEVFARWKIPELIRETLAHQHHDYQTLQRAGYLDEALVYCVNFACKLARLANLTTSGIEYISFIEPKMFEYFKFYDVQDYNKLMRKVHAEFLDYLRIFNLEGISQHPLEISKRINLLAFDVPFTTAECILGRSLVRVNYASKTEPENNAIILVYDKISLNKAIRYISTFPLELKCLVLCNERHIKVCKTQMSHPNLQIATRLYLNNLDI